MNKVIRAGKVITHHVPFRLEKNVDILIEHNILKGIFPSGEKNWDKDIKFYDFSNRLVTPGFIQTHIHLCQTLFRGLADDVELLDWLYKTIFPLEAAHNENSIRYSALLGISELIRSGTTTIMDMGTINHENIIIETVDKSGMRAVLGKAMMDINGEIPSLKESTENSIKSSEKLAKLIQNKNNDRLNYAFTPRFILSCTDELLIEAFNLTKDFPGTLFHTHASENGKEVKEVYNRCNMGNIEYFNKLEILSEKSCLAHCIWLSENEMQILIDQNSKVLHCPSSNLKLGSGVAKIPTYIKEGIVVSLGADGAPCNNNLSMLTEMRLASLIQKPFSPSLMDAETVFDIATMGGARTLGKENEIGSIEVEKKADLVFWDMDKSWNPLIQEDLKSLFATIVYSAKEENIRSVMVDGEFLMEERKLNRIDEEEIIRKGREELKKILDKI
jgi:cytosine/adenosine deaminase-related metal-dependent hydrolase